jgi:hypothetical protein
MNAMEKLHPNGWRLTEEINLNKKIIKQIKPLIGKPSCRSEVGEWKTISLGFGEKIYHNNPNLREPYYGEWEAGTYSCAWRIRKGNNILIGSNNTEKFDELNKKIKTLNFGYLERIEVRSEIDVEIILSNGIVIDIFATISDVDEEYFHIFCPDNLWVGLLPGGKWIVKKSDSHY